MFILSAAYFHDESARIGVYKCSACRKPFTVKVGTGLNRRTCPCAWWLQAILLIASSKKGISTNRTLGSTLKAAWLLSHRVRAAMQDDVLDLFGAYGGVVAGGETFIGRDFDKKPKGETKGRGFEHKNKVFALVDRETGKARSIVVDDLKAATLIPLMHANISPDARVMTDEALPVQELRRALRLPGLRPSRKRRIRIEG